MSDYLPGEVLEAVFLKLPIRTLGKCMSVCKSWKKLITNPAFIANHLNQTNTNKNNQLFLINKYFGAVYKERYSLYFDDNETFVEHKALQFPKLKSNEQYFNRCSRVIGSSNGLVCWLDEKSDWNHRISQIVIWNPTIDRYLDLPMPSVTRTSYGTSRINVLGFGYDAKSSDYKVVNLMYIGGVPVETEVYSLQSRSWKAIGTNAPYYVHPIWSQVFVRGAAHWLAYFVKDKIFNNLVMTFDMNNEAFGELGVPQCLVYGMMSNVSIALLGENISVLQYGHRYFNHVTQCEIWVMKEYGVSGSWTKRYSIDLEGGFHRILGLRNNGEMFLTYNLLLMSYHPQSKQVKEIKACGNASSFHLYPYVESLALLEDWDSKHVLEEVAERVVIHENVQGCSKQLRS